MADKVVQLVDKNSNNLYPVAGAAITNAISTGAISSQAVTSAKIANGNVTGVANNATVVGNTQLALDTVGTPNLRDQSVTSDKIDWTTFTASGRTPDPRASTGCVAELRRTIGLNSYQFFAPTATFPRVEITATAVRSISDQTVAAMDKGCFFVNMAYQDGAKAPSLWMINYRATGTNPTTELLHVQPIFNTAGTTFSISGGTVTFNGGQYCGGSIIYPSTIDIVVKDR